MKISTSAALALASSAALVQQSNGFTAPLSFSKDTSSLKMAGMEISDGGKKKRTEDAEMQLKRMNFQFNRGGTGVEGDDTPRVHPLQDIQSYVPVAEPVLTRKNIQGSTCVVSGGRATPELFYMLNDEDSAFRFNKIVSVSQDVSRTKKQLLTRTARYTGLLNKLAHETGNVVPPANILEEASSWIALVDTVEDLQSMIPSANQVENLSILYFYTPQDEAQLESLSVDLMAVNPNASLVLIPQIELEEDPEIDPDEVQPTPIMYYYEPGKGEPLVPQAASEEPPAPVASAEEGEGKKENEAKGIPKLTEPKLLRNPAFIASEANRLAVECLQLQAAAGKTLKVQCMERKGMMELMQLLQQETPSTQNLFTKLILGLREAGYERSQEMAYMMDKGVVHLKEAIDKFSNANPSLVKSMRSGASATTKDGEPIKTTNAWWEDPEFQKLVKESSLRRAELEEAKRLEEASSGETEASAMM